MTPVSGLNWTPCVQSRIRIASRCPTIISARSRFLRCWSWSTWEWRSWETITDRRRTSPTRNDGSKNVMATALDFSVGHRYLFEFRCPSCMFDGWRLWPWPWCSSQPTLYCASCCTAALETTSIVGLSLFNLWVSNHKENRLLRKSTSWESIALSTSVNPKEQIIVMCEGRSFCTCTDGRWLEIAPHCFCISVKCQCMDIVMNRCCIVSNICTADAEIGPSSHVVWFLFQASVVRTDGVSASCGISLSGSQFVPEWIVVWSQTDGGVKQRDGFFKVTSEMMQDAEGNENIDVRWMFTQNLMKSVHGMTQRLTGIYNSNIKDYEGCENWPDLVGRCWLWDEICTWDVVSAKQSVHRLFVVHVAHLRGRHQDPTAQTNVMNPVHALDSVLQSPGHRNINSNTLTVRGTLADHCHSQHGFFRAKSMLQCCFRSYVSQPLLPVPPRLSCPANVWF